MRRIGGKSDARIAQVLGERSLHCSFEIRQERMHRCISNHGAVDMAAYTLLRTTTHREVSSGYLF